mgnify:CR=1 FL=1|jgi:hypothetical protein
MRRKAGCQTMSAEGEEYRWQNDQNGSSIDHRKRRRQKDNKGRMVWQIWSRKRKRMKKPL